MNLTDIQSRIDRLEGFYQALKGQEKTIAEEITELKADNELLTKASVVIKHLLDTMTKSIKWRALSLTD
jgi:hypothetical protein